MRCRGTRLLEGWFLRCRGTRPLEGRGTADPSASLVTVRSWLPRNAARRRAGRAGCLSASTGSGARSCSWWRLPWSSASASSSAVSAPTSPLTRPARWPPRRRPPARPPQAPRRRVPSAPRRPARCLAARAGLLLVAPTGACAANEVSVVPSVPVAQAGRPIVILLQLAGHPAGLHLRRLPGRARREGHLRRRPDLVEPGLPERDPAHQRRGAQRRTRRRCRSPGAGAAPTAAAATPPPGRCRGTTTWSPQRSAPRRPTCSSR